MTKIIYTLGIVFCWITLSLAQDAPGNVTNMDCNDQFAGNISLGDVSAQSDIVNLNTSFLCMGDAMEILNTNANLTGDPEPLTPPGIAYVIYDCPPSVSGPTKADLLTDACLNQTDPIVINGNPFPLSDFWIIRGDGVAGETVTFENTGILQEAYNNNDPVQFWFAPVTLHDFASGGFEDGNTSCLHVNVDEAFSIVFLNEIQVSDFQTSVDGNGCTGSFLVEGGTPEFDGLSYDDISIYKTDSPDIIGVLAPLSVSNTHGDVVEFNVFQAGEYTIEITDNSGCSFSFTMNMDACPPVEFFAADVTASSGEEVCFTISTDNFEDVLSLQFSFTYDSSLLQFDSVQNFILPEFYGSSFYNPEPGAIIFSWFDPNTNGVTLPDQTAIFDLCFTAIGGDIFTTELVFTGEPTPFEAIDNMGNPLGMTFSDALLVFGSSGSDGGIKQDDFAVVAPNPFRENPELAVAYPGGGMAALAVYDASGQQVLESNFHLSPGKNSRTVEGLDQLPPGVYFLEIVYPNAERSLVKLARI